MATPEELETAPHVTPNAYATQPDKLTGAMISLAADAYYTAQEERLGIRINFGAIRFADVKFLQLTQDQLDATVAATMIVSHHPVDLARELEFYRADHELTTGVVINGYYRLWHYGILRTYLEASGRIDQTTFEEQLDKIREVREEEGPIAIPLMHQLTLSAMHSLDARVFYSNFALNVEEPVLREQLEEFAQDEVNWSTLLLGRVNTELKRNPESLAEVEAALLGYKPYGHDFDPEFEAHRATMLKVSAAGLVRVDLVRQVVEQLVGPEHLSFLEQQRPFREKLLAA